MVIITSQKLNEQTIYGAAIGGRLCLPDCPANTRRQTGLPDCPAYNIRQAGIYPHNWDKTTAKLPIGVGGKQKIPTKCCLLLTQGSILESIRGMLGFLINTADKGDFAHLRQPSHHITTHSVI